jgi:hypothetical protein
MDVDKFMFKKYVDDVYTCQNFARDVWLELTGEDLSERLAGLLGSKSSRKVRLSHVKAFTRLAHPISPCLIMFTQFNRDPHIGVFYQGRVLHLNLNGPEYLPIQLAGRGFTDRRFYQ